MFTTPQSVPLGQGLVSITGSLHDKVGFGVKRSGAGWTIAGAQEGIGCCTDGGTALGDPCAVSIGQVKGIAGGTVAAGDPVTTDANGRWVAATAAQKSAGVALHAASNLEVVEMHLDGRLITTP